MEEEVTKFNLNDYVYVKLSQAGLQKHREEWERVFCTPDLREKYPYTPLVPDVNGAFKFQAHDFIYRFGSDLARYLETTWIELDKRSN